jgi:hypothetical protein
VDLAIYCDNKVIVLKPRWSAGVEAEGRGVPESERDSVRRIEEGADRLR